MIARLAPTVDIIAIGGLHAYRAIQRSKPRAKKSSPPRPLIQFKQRQKATCWSHFGADVVGLDTLARLNARPAHFVSIRMRGGLNVILETRMITQLLPPSTENFRKPQQSDRQQS